jgi:hypothetical protein
MADAPKPDEVASSEPKLAATETIQGDADKEETAKEEAAPAAVR